MHFATADALRECSGNKTSSSATASRVKTKARKQMVEEVDCSSKTTKSYKAGLDNLRAVTPATSMLSHNLLRLIVFVLIMLVVTVRMRSVFVSFFYCQEA